jgi:hypothetical protein
MIATPGGKISSNQIYRKVPIQLGSNLIKIDLLLLDLEGMDVLLGMDWMTRHRVSLDIFFRTVEIDSPDYEATILYLPQCECNTSCTYAVEGIKLKDICGRTNSNYTGSSTRVCSCRLQRASNGIILWPVG